MKLTIELFGVKDKGCGVHRVLCLTQRLPTHAFVTEKPLRGTGIDMPNAAEKRRRHSAQWHTTYDVSGASPISFRVT
jgi:hypothetical protein